MQFLAQVTSSKSQPFSTPTLTFLHTHPPTHARHPTKFPAAHPPRSRVCRAWSRDVGRSLPDLHLVDPTPQQVSSAAHLFPTLAALDLAFSDSGGAALAVWHNTNLGRPQSSSSSSSSSNNSYTPAPSLTAAPAAGCTSQPLLRATPPGLCAAGPVFRHLSALSVHGCSASGPLRLGLPLGCHSQQSGCHSQQGDASHSHPITQSHMGGASSQAVQAEEDGRNNAVGGSTAGQQGSSTISGRDIPSTSSICSMFGCEHDHEPGTPLLHSLLLHASAAATLTQLTLSRVYLSDITPLTACTALRTLRLVNAGLARCASRHTAGALTCTPCSCGTCTAGPVTSSSTSGTTTSSTAVPGAGPTCCTHSGMYCDAACGMHTLGCSPADDLVPCLAALPSLSSLELCSRERGLQAPDLSALFRLSRLTNLSVTGPTWVALQAVAAVHALCAHGALQEVQVGALGGACVPPVGAAGDALWAAAAAATGGAVGAGPGAFGAGLGGAMQGVGQQQQGEQLQGPQTLAFELELVLPLMTTCRLGDEGYATAHHHPAAMHHPHHSAPHPTLHSSHSHSHKYHNHHHHSHHTRHSCYHTAPLGHLRSLALSGHSSVGDSDLAATGHAAPNLTHLSLCASPAVTWEPSQGWIPAAGGHPTGTVRTSQGTDAYGSRMVTASGVARLLAAAPQLRGLRLARVAVTGDAARLVAAVKGLRELDLSGVCVCVCVDVFV